MTRILVFLVAVVVALTSSMASGDAAQISAHGRHHSSGIGPRESSGKAVDWKQRDTAMYVVSTVNLLRTSSGHPLARIAERRLDVARYDVYADASLPDLYFIQLTRDDGTVAGGLVYQMGWPKPQSVTTKINTLGVTPAPPRLADAYKSDQLTLIGTFSTTMPR